MQKNFLVSIFVLFLSVFIINLIYPLKTLFWNKFTSYRVPLTFLYPKNFPLIQCDDIYLTEPLNYKEWIVFSPACDFDYSKKPFYGQIIVSKVDKNKEELQETGFLGVKLEYKKLTIGNTQGYKLFNKSQTTDKSIRDKKSYYYVFSKGYKYEIIIEAEDKIIKDNINFFLKTFRF